MNARLTPLIPRRAASPGGPRRLAALAACLGALLALLLGVAAPADAHAALIRTDPADGSVVQSAPSSVLLTFSEGVLLSADSLRVLDPQGKDVAAGKPQHAASGKDTGSTATVPLRTGLGDGTYTVAWKAISQDSHPVAGAFTFSVGAPSKTSVDLSGVSAVGGGAAATLYGIGRYVAYAGFALLVGSSVFLSVCWPRGALLRSMQRLAAGGWAALVAATIALLMLRGPYANGTGLGDAVDLDVIRQVLETRPGAALVSRLLLLAAAAVFLAVLFGSYAKREDPEERADLAWGLGIGGTVVAIGIAATWAMAEHASVGIQHQIAMPVDIVHLLSMAVWLGGLITLLTALYSRSTAGTVEAYAVRRFSLIALTAVTLLIGTGTYQAWRQMGSWAAFFDTHYGKLLFTKICLVCALVGVAWFSRRWTRELGVAPVARTEAVAVGSSAASGSVAVKGSSGTASGSGTGTGSGPGTGPDADPARAAQLRRQQNARDTATAKKLRDADPARGRLRRSVLTEALVAVVLLTITTMLTGSQPGRAAEEQKDLKPAPSATSTGGGTGTGDTSAPARVSLSIPYDTGGPNGKGTAGLTVSPARPGANEIQLFLTTPSGAPVDAPEVHVQFTLPAQKIGPIDVTLQHLTKGHWSAAGVQLPLAGTWQVSVTVRTSDIDEVTQTRNMQVTQ
ncbi:copper transport protein [Actinacidiphila alni]|uniref:Copper transport protein n=1 Tax=Actinacidiphila alni TaxID=380248 RepID=A0A1I1Z762_9ACTN|nr:FixH family protein [Actinacidiphila alni]SFE27529.1 copper transport protein [Actinacidiphila alni]